MGLREKPRRGEIGAVDDAGDDKRIAKYDGDTGQDGGIKGRSSDRYFPGYRQLSADEAYVFTRRLLKFFPFKGEWLRKGIFILISLN